MAYDPRPPTPPRGEPRQAYGGFVLVTVLAVLAIVFVVWLLGNDDTDGDPSGTTSPGIETTLPDLTTIPEGTTTAP